MPNTQAPTLDVPDNGGEFAADNGQHQASILDVPDNGGEFAVDHGQHPASILDVPDNGGEFAADSGQHPASILDVPDNGGEFAADSGQHPASILEVRDLEVEFAVEDGKIKVLDGVSFNVAPGQTLGIVGESGCGKSVTSLAIMGLLPKPHGQVVAGSIRFQGEELLSLAPDQMYKVRGNRISMIFQEPMTALNPVQTVGEQLMEVFRLHRPEYDKAQRKAAAIAMLQKVGIPEPAQRFEIYPHNLSGGMRQRVMIAMALSCEPDLLICDEPTTALDVTIQAQILDLMKGLQAQTGMAIIFITHDLGVVAELCDEVVVMYAGRAVEQADVFELFERPRHPYTHGLMSSIPRLEDEPKSLLKTIKGQVPALHEMPAGCRFSNRCPHATDHCIIAIPAVEQLNPRHHVACHYWKELTP